MKNVPKMAVEAHENEENAIHSHGENDTCSDMQKEIWLILFEEFGDSVSSIYRYIRLDFLIPELLEVMDINKMRILTAVEPSYLCICCFYLL